MTDEDPPLGSDEQAKEAVRESNDAPQGLETDEKAWASVKASNDAQFDAEKEGKDAAP